MKPAMSPKGILTPRQSFALQNSISITKSFIFLVALGGVITLIAWQVGNAHAFMFLFWNLLLFCLLVLDAIITPSGKIFLVQRSGEDILYFGAENEIEFSVKNNSSHILLIHAKPEHKRHINIDENTDGLSHWLQPNQEEIFYYTAVPSKRGSFDFDKIYLRWSGLLGLCLKYAEFSCPTEYKVYPNVQDLSKFRLMFQKKRLLPPGEKTVKNQGVGYEFESLRPYADGDDFRRINHSASARENRLIVNQYQIERNQPVYILLDIGRPMSYSVNGCKKLDYAINAALILSDIVNQQGDKAGLMVFDSVVRSHLAPGQGAIHRNNLIETLYRVEDNRSTSDYGGALQTLCEKQKRRSLVFIFTDFELPEEARELISHMALLKKRHLPIIVFMENESLNALAENSSKANRYDRYLCETAQEFQSERRDIFRHLSAMGIPNVESNAENFAVAAVNRYISLTK
ncbi:MAG: DUF58 domain-containing protein [Defluviitaleaceae bacterium]|nr:DUF58 domain-containing protein [Defluviitaleaceae bacterium]